jgi:uncharacterized repeat protein (TIGR03803 family)
MNTNKLQHRLAAGLLLSFMLSILLPLASGQTFELLHSFRLSDGALPGELIQGTDGSFYGATALGGNLSVHNGSGYGTVFKITSDRGVTKLMEFDGTNGAEPKSALVQGTDGSFYGITPFGGTGGSGTVFKMTPDGILTTLVLLEYGRDAGNTVGLVQGRDGSFYGTTPGNLISDYGSVVSGAVFKLTADGSFTNLVKFNGFNGSYPNGELVQGTDGSFYGTTLTGGDLSLYWGQQGTFFGIVPGLGTVFKVTPGGILTNLVQFEGGNGALPRAGLIQGSDGNFYGTTSAGGDFDGGTVFRITPDSVLTTLISFDIPPNQPQFEAWSGPWARLLEGRDGNLYGTTRGWTVGGGTVFQLTPDGTLITLVTLGGTNGSNLQAGLVQGKDGNFYGTAYSDGNGWGTVYRIVMPSPPTLNLSLNGTQLVLSWPTNADGFGLQTSPNLDSPNSWIASNDSPVIVGDQYFVTNAISGNARFFRLKK